MYLYKINFPNMSNSANPGNPGNSYEIPMNASDSKKPGKLESDYEKIIFNDMNKLAQLMNNKNLSNEERKIYAKLLITLSAESNRETKASDIRAKMVDTCFLQAKKAIVDASVELKFSINLQVPEKISNEIVDKLRLQNYIVSDPITHANCKSNYKMITISW